MIEAMSPVRLAGILFGILVSLAGAFLLQLSQTPSETVETFTTTVWTSEAGPDFDKSLHIRPGESRSLRLQDPELIHMGDWVQVGFMITDGTLDVMIQDHDMETIREIPEASGRLKISFFAPREAAYYLVLRNSKSNSSTRVLDFHETIYRLTRPLLTKRIEAVRSPLSIVASLMIIALGAAAAAYAFRGRIEPISINGS